MQRPSMFEKIYSPLGHRSSGFGDRPAFASNAAIWLVFPIYIGRPRVRLRSPRSASPANFAAKSAGQARILLGPSGLDGNDPAQ